MISQELWDQINKCSLEYEPCRLVFKELTSIILKESKSTHKEDFGVLLKEIRVNLLYPTRKKGDLQIFKKDLIFADLRVVIAEISNIFVFDTPLKTKPHWTVVISCISKDIFIGIGMDSESKEEILNSLLNIGEIRKIGLQTCKEFVPAYLKNKDGYLYFLENGIFYGFKKPILYFSKRDIVSMNVLCITARTFNLNVNLKDKSWEFSMIDQNEYDKISKFMEKLQIKGNDLQEIKENSVGNLDTLEFGEDDEEDEDFRLSGSDSEDYNDSESDSNDSDSNDSDSKEDGSQESQGEESFEADSDHESVQKVSEEKVHMATEQENISDENESRRKKRKSTPKKLSGMQVTADAVRKQLESRIGSITTLKKIGVSSKEAEISRKNKDTEIISIDSDVDELDD